MKKVSIFILRYISDKVFTNKLNNSFKKLLTQGIDKDHTRNEINIVIYTVKSLVRDFQYLTTTNTFFC